MRRSTPRRIAIGTALLLGVAALVVLLWNAAEPDDGTAPTLVPAPVAAPTEVREDVAESPAPAADEPILERLPVSEPVVPRPATLVVHVVDAESNAARARAEVSIVDAAGVERCGLSDAKGSVRFEKLPPGATEIHVAADGMFPVDSTGVLAANATERVEIALDSASALDGVVVDATTGAPIAKATVDVFARDDEGERPLGETSSDPAGRFRFDVLPPATDVVVRGWAAGSARAATTATVRAAGAGAARVELRLPRAGVLRGVVRLPDGRGAPRASVKVVPAAATGWDGVFAESGADGSFVVHGVPAGVEVAATAHLWRWADSLTQSVTVPADRGEAVCDLTVRRPATLLVRVSGPARYAPSVKVWVDDDRDSGGRSSEFDPQVQPASAFDPNPVFAATIHRGLTPGPHVVHVEPNSRWERSAPTTREIALAEGEQAQIDIVLAEGVTIEGVLVDDAGTPVAGASVFALPSDFAHRRRRVSGAASTGESKPDGAFRITGVAPGRYDLFVLGGREYGLASPEIDPTRTDVDAPSRGVRIIVARETRIVLRVAMPDGVPRPPDVALTQDSGDGLNVDGDSFRKPALAFDAAAWTDDGVVKCAFPPGATWLRVSVPGFASESIRVPQWAFGRVVDLGEITPDPGTSLRGRVIDSAGRPVAGAAISTSADPPGRVPTRANDDGTFVVEHVAQGGICVYAAADGRIGSRYVTEAFDAKTVTIVARRKGVLHGTVVDAADRPVAGARVTFRHGGSYGPGGSYEGVIAVADDAVTGDDGTFTCPVPNGLCLGRVAGADFEAFVPEGGEATVRVVTGGS